MNGIASAAYTGGRWAIWGAHCADYDQSSADSVNVAETNRMMLYYVSNDFQQRRAVDVDQPLTPNDIKNIASQEQSRLDALVNSGMLTYGEVKFKITATPLAKSLTADVNWTEDGFATYFADVTAD